MTNRILFRAHANEHSIDIKTYAPRTKSPQRFYIAYSEFDRLRSEGRLLTDDIRSFAVLRLDEPHDRITFEFTWLSGLCFDRVEGYEQTVHLRWSKFRAFLDECQQPDGPTEFKAVSLDARKGRPRLVFVGNRANLKAAIGNPRIRHKLAKALMENFNWPDAEAIYLANDFVPYSFVFKEMRNGWPCLCGGLILHGQEDMDKAYYGIHT